MKTLNKEKSKQLFFRIKELGSVISMLIWVVQNPDFVTEDNAQENYENFYNGYKSCIRSLDEIREQVYELHKELIN